MQIIIDIPENQYSLIMKSDRNAIERFVEKEAMMYAIKNGIPLPKGHKVIDAYALQEHLALVPMEDRTYREAVEIIDRFPSIIEADRSEK